MTSLVGWPSEGEMSEDEVIDIMIALCAELFGVEAEQEMRAKLDELRKR